MHLVHPLPAVHRSTVTWNLVLVIFKVKLIIIAELFSFLYPPVGADDNLVSSLKGHDFSHTVRGTGVVDVSARHIRKLSVKTMKSFPCIEETKAASRDVLAKQV